MKNHNWCVYKHTSPNGKIYIGITHLKTSNRWRSKGQGYKNCPYFYNAILKYGWENFKHEIIENNLTEHEAYCKEIEYIKIYNSLVPNGYNIDEGGYSGTKFKKSVLAIDRYGVIKYEFPSITEAGNFFKCSPSSISKALSRNGTCKDYIFVYKNDLEFGKTSIDYLINKAPKYKKIVYQYDFKTRKFISKYDSIAEASKMTNTNRTSISACLSGKAKTANGFIWSYSEIIDFSKFNYIKSVKTEPVEVIKISMNGRFIKKYHTIGEAAKENNLHRSNISACIHGKTKNCGGYIWRIEKKEEYINKTA